MSDTNPWIEALYKFGPAACEGVLAALVVARGGPRAAPEEPAVPSSWRARQASTDPNTPDRPPRPHATEPSRQPGPSTERRPSFQPVELKLKDFGSPPGPATSSPVRQPAPQAAPGPESQPASQQAPAHPNQPAQPQSCPAPPAGTTIMQSPDWATSSTSTHSAPPISTARTSEPEAPVVAPSTSQKNEPLAPVATLATPAPTNNSQASAAQTAMDQPRPGAPVVPSTAPVPATSPTSPVPAPAPTSPTIEPQMELDFSPRPPPPPPPQPESQPSPPTTPGASEVDAMLGAVIRLFTTVIGETVRQSIDTAVERLEQAHARERDALTERFEAALRSQDARLHEVLEHQARQHTEDLRVILRDALAHRPTTEASPPTDTTDALEEFQETLRMGFGEVRGALDRHHHALMTLIRAELPPLAQAARNHLNRPEPPRPPAADEPRTPATPPSRASPPRASPARDEHAASRLHAAIQDTTPEDLEHIDDLEEPHRRHLQYRPPDDDNTPHFPEASP